MWTKVPAAALESALLPGSRMLASAAALAGGEAAGQTASGRSGQSPTRRGPAGAPSACRIFAATTQACPSCGSAWSRSKIFCQFFVRSARVPSGAPKVGPPPGKLLLSRLPSGGSPGARSRTQVASPRHFPGPAPTRAGVSGGPGATLCQTRRHHQHDATTTTSVSSTPQVLQAAPVGSRWSCPPSGIA